MQTKNITVVVLVVTGIYFLLFHSAPFPFNHEVIGLPPYHTLHAAFGAVLLVVAWWVAKKKSY